MTTRRELFQVVLVALGLQSLLGRAASQHAPAAEATHSQLDQLAMLADQIVPGAREAGLAAYLQRQFKAAPNDSLLVAKYFEIPPPYLNFYLSGLAAARALARDTFKQTLEELHHDQVCKVIEVMAHPQAGDPSFIFYMCLRLDAADVVYGTPAGFQALNIPYAEHILPPDRWNV